MERTIFQYKVAIFMEKALGNLLLGAGKVDPIKFSEFLNKNGIQGWEVITIERENRRMFLFFQREAFICVMKRSKVVTVSAPPADDELVSSI